MRSIPRRWVPLACLCVAVPGLIQAQAIQLKDIQTNHAGASSSTPRWLTNAGATTFFVATTPNDGAELWRTDGTAAGTFMVRDIQAGPGSSSPSLLTQVGSGVYFCTSTWGAGCPLWKSDGTFAGTQLVADVAKGNPNAGIAPVPFATDGTSLFFVANDGTHGNELWKTTLATGATAMVLDLNPSGASDPNQLTILNGNLYFVATDGVHGPQLWKRDSTSGAVSMVNTPAGDATTGARVSSLTAAPNVAGGRLFFSANDGTNGQRPWVSDGTNAGTRQLFIVADTDYNPVDFVELGSQVYFNALAGGSPPEGHQLFSTDGITLALHQFGATGPPTNAAPGDPHWITNLNGRLVFTETEQNSKTIGAGIEPFSLSAGSPALLRDIYPGGTVSQPNSSISYTSGPQGMTVVGPYAYFVANSGSGLQLWRTDGSLAGTVLVAPFAPNNANPGVDFPMVSAGSYLLFAGDDGAHGQELWRVNSDAGVFLVKDIVAGNGSSIDPNLPAFSWTALGANSFFPADDGIHGVQPWKTDGTGAGTQLLAAIGSPPGSTMNSVFAGGNALYFTAYEPTHGLEPWISDGTPANTQLVSDIAPGPASSNVCELQPVGNQVFLNADDGVHGAELWTISASGATLVQDIRPAGSSFPRQLTPVASSVLFTADDGVSGRELWASNGTSSGTYRVADLDAGAGSSNPANLTAVGSTVYFSANRTQLWKSGGTSATTLRLADVGLAPGASIPDNQFSDGGTCYQVSHTFTQVGDDLFFVADDGLHGLELWRTHLGDGGTALVADIFPGPQSSGPQDLIAMNHTVFFTADDGSNGRELWRSDGTQTGTALVLDINPGNSSALIQHLTVVGNRLYFAAFDPMHGVELWNSNGTASGTFRVEDLTPGPSSSNPGPFQVMPGTLLFPATDGSGDREPWALAVDTTPPAVSHQVLGPDGGNDWFVGNVDISFVITDSFSPIDSDAGCGPARVTVDTPGQTFTCVAVAAGGTTTDSVTVKRDTVPPIINCPLGVFVEATHAAGAPAQYPRVTAQDALDPSPTLTFSIPPGSPLPFGPTPVTAVAHDAAGNASVPCTFSATVRDTTPPVPSCPQDVYSESSGANGSVVTFPPATAVDAVDPSPVIEYSQASGSRFSNGVTPVTVTATDAAGNSATCSFDVLIGCTSATTCQTARKSEYAFGCNSTRAEPWIGAALLLALGPLSPSLRKRRV